MPKGVYLRKPRPPKQDDPGIVRKVRDLYRYGRTQAEVAGVLDLSQKAVFGIMRRNGIVARTAAKRDQFGEKNHAWKGDGASYQALHVRLYKRFGKPSQCSVCGTKEAPAFDYANLTGNYTDLSDYAPMCRSCHHKFDGRAANLQPKEASDAKA